MSHSDDTLDLAYARLALEAINDLSTSHDEAQRMARVAIVELGKSQPRSPMIPLDALPPGCARCRECRNVFALPAVAVCPTCGSRQLSRRASD